MKASMKPTLTKTKNNNYYSESDPGELRYPGEHKRLSVTDDEANILKKLVKGLRVLEIGTGLGVATRAMAETALEVTSIDIDPWTHQFSFPDNVKLLQKTPRDKFDIAFIDGSHKHPNVVTDIKTVNAPILILHDCYNQGVKRAIVDTKLIEVELYGTVCDMRRFVR